MIIILKKERREKRRKKSDSKTYLERERKKIETQKMRNKKFCNVMREK